LLQIQQKRPTQSAQYFLGEKSLSDAFDQHAPLGVGAAGLRAASGGSAAAELANEAGSVGVE
jgi:hypothetical protein